MWLEYDSCEFWNPISAISCCYNLLDSMTCYPLKVDLHRLELLGIKCMSYFVLPEILRELRGWTSSVGCPWGAIGLAICLIGCCCWVTGFIFASIIFSHQCRRLLSFAARALSVGLAPAGVQELDLRGRLSQYHRNS